MRVLQTRYFSKFARKAGIRRSDLQDAVQRLSEGLVDANLGGGLFKQRIARPGSGRSGGFRTILIYRWGDRAVFVYGFAKNMQANIDEQDLSDLRYLAKRVLSFTERELEEAVQAGDFLEVL